ncbi:hypothetical protein GCM10011594_43460 [Nakamurella endophytica]|uniref:Uncharacterized protein n=1 Tax=Nakamurella endophytica TaxID=1748367 RepID=A0A917WP88_9ACTN|nr:hypothetical protein GCM10011594_43460 [Nakamurella endophytica]
MTAATQCPQVIPDTVNVLTTVSTPALRAAPAPAPLDGSAAATVPAELDAAGLVAAGLVAAESVEQPHPQPPCCCAVVSVKGRC